MTKPLQSRQPWQTQRWLKPCGVLSLLAGCYLLTDAAQAFNPFSQRVMQSHLPAGLAQLSRANVQPLALITESRLNSILSNGLKSRRLDQDMQLLSQIKQDSPTVDEPETTETDSEPLVQVTEVIVEAHSSEIPPNLKDLVYEVIETRPGGITTRSQLQQDVNKIFSTGFFADVYARPEDTELGARVTFIVELNPVLTGVRVRGNQVLPQTVVDEIFEDQQGEIINLIDFQEGMKALIQWYQDQGYILAQVLENPRVTSAGVVTLEVVEGVIDTIEVLFQNIEGKTTDESGNPVQGETQEYVITREFRSLPGEVFNQVRIEQDFQRVLSLGIFEDVRVIRVPSPENPQKVNIIVNILERNTRSIGGGLGFRFSGDVYATGTYRQDNLFGRGQRLALAAEVGLQEVTVETLLNSPGTPDGLPVSPPSLVDAINAVATAQNRTRREAIVETENLRLLSQYNNQQAIEALALNNLADLYEDPTKTLNTYNDAFDIISKLKSPVMESYMLLRQAGAYRELSQPQKALRKYVKALDILTEYQYERDPSIWLGEAFLDILSDEWQLQDEDNQIRGSDTAAFLDLIRLGVLSDTIFTYSVLGDYQASLYISNSQDFSKISQYLAEDFSFFLDYALISLEGDSESHGIKKIFKTLMPEIKEFFQSHLISSSKIYRSQVLELIFSDLGESDSAAAYQQSVDSIGMSSRRKINSIIYQFLLGLTSDDFLDRSSFPIPELVPSLKQAHELIPHTFDVETQAWRLEGLQAVIDLLGNSLMQYFSELGDEEVASLINQSRGLIEFLLENFILAVQFEKGTPEYHRYILQLSQAAMQSWPGQGHEFNEFEWVKGFILKLQGDAYYQLGDYEGAVSAYESSIQWLVKAEEFYQEDYKDSSPKVKNWVEEVRGMFGSQIDHLFLTQRLDAVSNSANAYLELQKPETAKLFYQDALTLNTQVTQRKEIYRQTEKAEIFYGIARAEAMLGNRDEAREAIKQTIAINEAFFPNEAVSGGSGILDVGFTYGYGVPYQGSISSNFKFESTNPWLAVNANQNFLSEQRCATVTQYFQCRQKYFDFYINWLLQEHQANPAAGYDILAFEASEQAKSFSFRRPDGEVSAQDRFAPPRSVREIQAAIGDENTLVLEFFLGEEASYLWMLAGDGALQVYTLPPRSEIETQAQTFYELLTSPTGRVRPQTTAKAGEALSQMLLGPVADQLGNQRLVIVADGFLQYLPFSVLPNPSPNTFPTDAALQGEYGPVLNPLLLDHEIVHLPSASTLVALRQNAPSRPQPTQELAFFANPVFNHKDERVEQVKLFEWSEPLTQAELDNVEALYSSIPATERELENILDTQFLPEDQVQTFFGYEANLESALSPDLGQFRIVHFASHGIFNSNAPERSGIVLSGLSEDGVVQAGLLSPTYAFNDMDLSATELVVLSGCRTGLSQSQVGREGMTGLTNGLFDAGAERVVSSLWSVRDDATRELMNRFYQLMLDPENPLRPAEALTEAQRSMWNEPRWQTPYNWAAFTLQGVWE